MYVPPSVFVQREPRPLKHCADPQAERSRRGSRDSSFEVPQRSFHHPSTAAARQTSARLSRSRSPHTEMCFDNHATVGWHPCRHHRTSDRVDTLHEPDHPRPPLPSLRRRLSCSKQVKTSMTTPHPERVRVPDCYPPPHTTIDA